MHWRPIVACSIANQGQDPGEEANTNNMLEWLYSPIDVGVMHMNLLVAYLVFIGSCGKGEHDDGDP